MRWRRVSAKAALTGCVEVLRRKGAGAAGAPPPTAATAVTVVQRFLQHIQVQAFGQQERVLAFDLLETAMEVWRHCLRGTAEPPSSLSECQSSQRWLSGHLCLRFGCWHAQACLSHCHPAHENGEGSLHRHYLADKGEIRLGKAWRRAACKAPRDHCFIYIGRRICPRSYCTHC